MQRREFLHSGSAALSATALAAAFEAYDIKPARAANLANDKVTVAVIGVRGRGANLLNTFASLPTVDVKYIVDLDPGVLGSRVESVAKQTGRKPEGLKDFRKALDDKAIDAIVLGTPDHWHALPTIYACQAKKDVYVEKPDGHNIMEGRTMVEAARKHGRVVQLGTQGRSGKHLASAMEYIRSGKLGKVVCAKAWESARQGAIPVVADSEPPAGFDYDFWLGPAPQRPFNKYRFHGNWRWFFDYGTGDLGNDGVHRLDMARWALETGVAAQKSKPLDLVPEKISVLGGKFYFEDAQEWPDTVQATFEYAGGYLLTYEMRVWAPYRMNDESEGAALFGDQGYMIIGNGRWRAFAARDKLVAEDSSPYNDIGHAQNFLDCMKSRGKPNADLETVGHPSSMLCHLGNAAWRAKRTLSFNSDNYTFSGPGGVDAAANQYLTRPVYRKPWLLPKLSEV